MRTKSTPTWVLLLTSIASLMVALDGLVVTTALSTIRADLGASVEQLEWTVNAYVLTFAVLLMTGAALGDRFGRRRVFVAGLGLFMAASAACALAPDAGVLVAARSVQGAGAALVMPAALALLSAAFPPERRARALGIFSGVTGLAVLGGPVVGGAIVEGISWHWIFWLNVPIGLALVPLVLRHIDESHGPRAALDLAGVVLVTGAALGVMWGLVRGNAVGWGSVEVVAALAAGLLLAIGFVARERRAREPMLPLQLFRSRAFSGGNVAIFCLFGSILAALFFLAQFFQIAQGAGPLEAGLRLLPWTASLFVVAPIAGRLVERLGERPLVAGGLFLSAVGMGWVALIATPDLAYVSLVPPLVIAGIGASMAMPATQSAVLNAVAPRYIGKASGAYNTTRQLGGAFGVAIAVALFAGAGSYATPQAFSDGLGPALGVCAGLALLGTAASLTLPGRRLGQRLAEERGVRGDVRRVAGEVGREQGLRPVAEGGLGVLVDLDDDAVRADGGGRA